MKILKQILIISINTQNHLLVNYHNKGTKNQKLIWEWYWMLGEEREEVFRLIRNLNIVKIRVNIPIKINQTRKPLRWILH